jgi:hypothetical protein
VDDLRVIWKVSIRRACEVLRAGRSTYHCVSRSSSQADLRQRIREIGYPKPISVDQEPETMAARNRAHLHARLEAFSDDRRLHLARPGATPRRPLQHLKPSYIAPSRSQQMLHSLFQSFAPNQNAKLAEMPSSEQPLYRWGARTGYGKPTNNAFIKSLIGKFRAECLKTRWFMNLADARRNCESSQVEYNNHRPRSAIGYEVPTTLMMSPGPGIPI